MDRKEHKDINEVYNEAVALFDDHPDLLEEFKRFFPKNPPTTVAPNVTSNRNLIQRPGERNLQNWHLVHCLWTRTTGSHADRDDSDDDKASLKVQKDQRKHPEKDINLNKRTVEVDDRESKHDNRDFNSHRIHEKGKFTRKVELLLACMHIYASVFYTWLLLREHLYGNNCLVKCDIFIDSFFR
ncbi:paired amphipathic helix protein Sin3-like 2 [Punica granatum]|uniref:Paired amphipathic helix protein Sin3-like 2 n=1 Tax=Punica granatum TaxID=22663 RepID=A0A6P8CEN7_PUNGR|nr:paired amphipathic helix protein Sin3-like 2 [Punica granatum]